MSYGGSVPVEDRKRPMGRSRVQSQSACPCIKLAFASYVHLTSGQKEGDELRRNFDVLEILRKTRFPRVHGPGDVKSPETIIDHEFATQLDLSVKSAIDGSPSFGSYFFNLEALTYWSISDCIPLEAEYHKQFLKLLLKVVSDYGALTASVEDFQWSQNFRELPTIWGKMLWPIPVALASCTRYFEAMTAMRETFAALQNLRVEEKQHLTKLFKVNQIIEVADGHSIVVCEGEIFVPCKLATVASGALLDYEVGGPQISVQTAYGVEVEMENNPYHPSLMVSWTTETI
ncbi:hypothetical protein GIB67_011482 [Kingdonia uniflora]|uniref:Uncharacterized protein n=1 Tax=Kingdonia uniflora TaxID=39325 RepID=A0A7J7NLL6_9MAGN|nr:hypothetical protein GIB67_011482 [Kingdonia uniflora]